MIEFIKLCLSNLCAVKTGHTESCLAMGVFAGIAGMQTVCRKSVVVYRLSKHEHEALKANFKVMAFSLMSRALI